MKMRALLRWRMLLGVGVLAALVAPLTATGGRSTQGSAKDDATQRLADLYQIDQIEVKFHRAAFHPQREPDDVAVGPRCRLQHRPADADRQGADQEFFRDREQGFMPNHHWESDTPSYKIRIDLNGDKATLYFECHYVDVKTGKVMAVVGVDHNAAEDQRELADRRLVRSTRDIARITGRPMARPRALDAPPASRRRAARVGRTTGSSALLRGCPPTCARSCWSRSWLSRRSSSSSASSGCGCSARRTHALSHLGTLQLRSATYQALQT